MPEAMVVVGLVLLLLHSCVPLEMARWSKDAVHPVYSALPRPRSRIAADPAPAAADLGICLMTSRVSVAGSRQVFDSRYFLRVVFETGTRLVLDVAAAD